MKKPFLGKDKRNLAGVGPFVFMIGLSAVIAFMVTPPSFAAAPPPPINPKFCSTYKQTSVTPANCQALVGKLNAQDITLLEDQTFVSALLGDFNTPSLKRATAAFAAQCQSSAIFPATTLAICTKQAANFAQFMNRILPGNKWPTQSLQTLATSGGLSDGTNKIKDQKHFVGDVGSFNHGLKTILLTGVVATDTLDTTGFIGKLWAFQSNT